MTSAFDQIGEANPFKDQTEKHPSDLDLSPAAVIASMARDADPVPTGFAPLDNRMRRGGVPPGRVISVGGAPFVGKTTVVADIALHVSQKIPVFALFSDEGRTQAAIRMGVMMGIPLDTIEENPGESALKLEELLGERSITLRKPDCDVATAEDMFALASSTLDPAQPAMIILDSIQTIPARRDMESGSEREAYKEFMKICRDKASGMGYIVLLTSQSNRASYRSRKSEENSVAIASFSGTAAIEFLSDVAMVMSLPDENSQIVKVEMVKNRLLGATNRLPRAFHIRYSPDVGRMVELDPEALQDANSSATIERLAPTCEAIRKLVESGPEKSSAEIERRFKGKGKGFGTSAIRAAVASLVERDILTEVYREGKGGGYFYVAKYPKNQ